jgi:cytochrome c-type biogenesis protein CcmF
MIPELGHFALALAVALAFAQGVIGIFAPGLRDPRAMRAAPALALSHFLAIGAAFLGLIYAGVVSDFTVENVADFSSSAVPLIYRISGTWGNHDGSMVLWCFILSLCGATVAAFGRTCRPPCAPACWACSAWSRAAFCSLPSPCRTRSPGSGRRRWMARG